MRWKVFPGLAISFVLFLAAVGCSGGDGGDWPNHCEGVDCGTQGRCALGAEGPLCICDSGFTVQDGVCRESPVDDPCAGVACAGNGACAVASGDTAVCVCRPGYQSDGASCVPDPEAPAACDGINCGGNGSCVVASAGDALCICDPGFRPDGTNCVATTDPCSGDSCSGHGSCVVTTSGPVCLCETGFVVDGADCVPDAGDPCDGVLCDGEGFCVATVDGPECVCNPGFRSASGRCLPVENVCQDIDCGGRGECLIAAGGGPVCLCETGTVAVGLDCVDAPEGAIPQTALSETDLAEVHPEAGVVYVPGELVVYAADGHDAGVLIAALTEMSGEILAYKPSVRRYQVRFPGPPTAAELSAIQESLAAREDVAVVDLVWVATPGEVREPNDPGWDQWGPVAWDDASMLDANWALKAVHAPQAWTVTTGTKRIKVGVIDFGSPSHADLSVKGVNLLPYPTSYTHGREVSGVIAALGDNTTGLTGVLWDADWYYCETNGTDARFFECLEALVNAGVQVVNYSAGTRFRSECKNAEPWTCPFPGGVAPEDSTLHQNDRLKRKAIWNDELKSMPGSNWILVQAAGNEALADAAYAAASLDVDDPGVAGRILTVGAVTSGGGVSPFSNRGALDLAAPGGDGSGVRDLPVLGASTRKAGTSYSAPLVAGVVALAWSVDPSLSAATVASLVKQGSQAANGTVNDGGHSYPRLDAMGAVQEVLDRCAAASKTFDPAQGQCVEGCVPSCTGKACGDSDGCGGQCFGVELRRCEGLTLWACDTRPQAAYVDCEALGKQCLWDAPRNTYNCIAPANPPPTGTIVSPGDLTTVTGDLLIVAQLSDDVAVAKATVVIHGPNGVEVARRSVFPGVAQFDWNVESIPTGLWATGDYSIGLWALDGDNPALLVDTISFHLNRGTCVPACGGKECGLDGCGGQCAPGCGDGICLSNGHCSTVTAGCANGWCLIPAGSFEMGSPDTEPCRNTIEGPVHTVTITRPFYMKQTEVTQGEWESRVGNNPSQFGSCGADCPLETVNWYEAVYYANLLSDEEGFDRCYRLQSCSGTPGNHMECSATYLGLECNGYRLPTEAEWEYAARAGTDTAYWVGTNIGLGGVEVCGSSDPFGISLPEAGWYAFNAGSKTHPVAELLANPWGLYDVHGNVWEWTNDFWLSDYAACEDGCTDPLGPATGSYRVARGGSWYNGAGSLRSAQREGSSPGIFAYHYGFRLARSIP